MRDADAIDLLVQQWEPEVPGLDLEAMSLVAHLLTAAQLVGGRIDALAAAHDLTRAEGDVVFTLRRAGPPYRLTPSQLAAALMVATATMTNRLDRLEARGLVRRLPNPDDRRSLAIELTAAGVALSTEAVHEHVAGEQEMLAPLSARDRADLRRVLRTLVTHLA